MPSRRPMDQGATACAKLQRVENECGEEPFLRVKLGPNLDQIIFNLGPNSEIDEKL